MELFAGKYTRVKEIVESVEAFKVAVSFLAVSLFYFRMGNWNDVVFFYTGTGTDRSIKSSI